VHEEFAAESLDLSCLILCFFSSVIENVKEVIAPFGWNARNASQTKWLGRPMNYYKKFTYV
jgi:hypothetical protein